MRIRPIYPIVAAAAIGAAALAIAVPAGAQGAGTSAACTYRLQRLPLPAGMNEASVVAVGGPTIFAGTASNRTVDDRTHAVLWQNGRATLLPTPDGFSSYGFGTNARGDVVGAIYRNGGDGVPVLWRGGRLVQLESSPDANTNARDINDAGTIVGDANLADGSNEGLVWTVFGTTSVRKLEPPAGYTLNSVVGINEAGVVAANVQGAEQGTAVPAVGRPDAVLQPLGQPRGAIASSARGIGGDVLGGEMAVLDGEDVRLHAVRWNGSTPTQLSKVESSGVGATADGVVVGNVDEPSVRAVVWAADGTQSTLPVITTGPTPTSSSATAVGPDGSVAGSIGTAGNLSAPVVWRCG